MMPKTTQKSSILQTLQKEIIKLDKQLIAMINSCEEYKVKRDLLKSVLDVGDVMVITVLSFFLN